VMRGILILTCSGVSFAHEPTTVRRALPDHAHHHRAFPSHLRLNPAARLSLNDLAGIMRDAEPLIRDFGDDQKVAAWALQSRSSRGN